MILTLVQTDGGGATEVSLEAVTFARTLAKRTGGPVHALVIGPLPQELVDQLAGYGVTEVHHATGEAFSAYGGAAWAAAVQAVVAAADPDAVVAPGSPRGLEVMAHLAARLDVPMAANVVGLGEGDGQDDGEGGTGALRLVRQVMGGAALEEMLLPRRPAVLTVAGHAVEAEQVPPVPAAVREFSPEVAEADLVTRVVSTEPAEPDLSGALTSARVVVGAGRGAGGADGFGHVAELAELLGGALGVSRVVTSMGWRPHHEQIGQTGSRISPELYIACGISGAIQHWAGCASSKTILAVNTDENAPMVTKATYAVIGDMHEVVPAINAEIRRRRG
ncbi:electron transfer flavoprotein subunit alpha/FixB family protein [Pseudonocardia sp. RS11V-5]|uniref:electron transfer flavoprotein subunit alpha/FixB family protein n=1 Tax=Pseudonocardia terrae TaxID=2905831 RepID=UPI001E6430A0|nr:electron transfer flavoprotein subunit alpha/FixB family protein [Pseudonocardia terrae]MCE3552724.1 electron transfer flavoprotein subunit alpha/FixB family protein [Pseudonocardia terrae]